MLRQSLFVHRAVFLVSQELPSAVVRGLLFVMYIFITQTVTWWECIIYCILLIAIIAVAAPSVTKDQDNE